MNIVDYLFSGGADTLRPFRNGEVIGKHDDGFTREDVETHLYGEQADDPCFDCYEIGVIRSGPTQGVSLCDRHRGHP